MQVRKVPAPVEQGSAGLDPKDEEGGGREPERRSSNDTTRQWDDGGHTPDVLDGAG